MLNNLPNYTKGFNIIILRHKLVTYAQSYPQNLCITLKKII